MKTITNNNSKKHYKFIYILWIVLFSSPIISCKKYLDAKPDQSITTPSTIEDLEGILDNYTFMNAIYPSASEVSSDSYYLTNTDWSSLNLRQRNFYTWQKFDDIGGDYSGPYQTIEYANILLETSTKVINGSVNLKNTIQGSALFTRASCHYALAQLFAKPYNDATASTDLGIALRLNSDISILPKRSTNTETYSSIISDLQRSVSLLPSFPQLKYRPSRPAAYGMLARVYLSMGNYNQAGLYADSCLKLYGKLIDYNNISSTATIPFQQFNDEVIYDARSSPPPALSSSKAKIDTILYSFYDSNDLRKTVLFKSNTNGSKAFKGNYTGQNNSSLFTGIATDEMYLIMAEAAVRGGNTQITLQNLNTLLVARWKKGTYTPYTLTDQKQLLKIILQERRKELLFRGLRWTDLRRLNSDAALAIKIYRNVSNQLYTLNPESLRYVFDIDQNAINISGLIQNP
jgi:hypothetical protein